MKVGVQGDLGSACDEAASLMLSGADVSFSYLTNADRTLAALGSGTITHAVLALESPVGTAIPETAEALKGLNVTIVAESFREVRHCLMIRSDDMGKQVVKIASHPIPLTKYRAFLTEMFPGYEPIVIEDSGLAARRLSEGQLPVGTAVIAMPRAANVFGLKKLELQLPVFEHYITKFVLVVKAGARS